MSLNIRELADNSGLTYYSEGNKHYRHGWLQFDCPWCNDDDGHLGWNINKEYFSCYRCGGKRTTDTLARLLNVSIKEAAHLRREYSRGTIVQQEEIVQAEAASSLELPRGTSPIIKGSSPWRYLKHRKYNPDKLIRTWKLRMTGGYGSYRYRIIAPVYFNEQLVSYLGRDWTGKSKNRYKNCAVEDEVIHLKSIVYGFDNVPGKTVVICEGPADAWRLGPGAVATCGINYSKQQLMLLSRSFDRHFVFFDNEDRAQEKAQQLAIDLNALGGQCEVLRCDKKDAGEINQDEADSLMQDIMSSEEL